MVEAFIFDMDGTLMDSEVLWVEAARLMLADKGEQVSADQAMALIYGRSWGDIHAEVVVSYPAMSSMASIEMQDLLREYYLKLHESTDPRIHGSVELLKRLALDFPVCVVSGCPRRELAAAIAELGIGAQLRFFLGSEDYPRGKPDPTCFLMAAERLGLSPEECLVFEDSCVGIAGAKAAGMTCVALQRPGAPRQDTGQADEVFSDLADFRVEKYVPRGV